jgi:hypothetical protein
VRSPFSISQFSYTFTRFGYSLLAIVLVMLVTGTGAAYASEGSVPGNPLYPLKVSIIEPAQGALITSAQGQAAWHAQLATRRLDEATKLASAHELDQKKQSYLQSQFDAQVMSSNQAADSLAVAGKTSDALEARSDLEARISAHAELLALLSSHLALTASSTDATFQGTQALLTLVEQRRNEVMSSRLALEDSADAGAQNPDVSAAALVRAEVSTQAVSSQTSASNNVGPVAARLNAARAAIVQAKSASGSSASNKYSHQAERSSEEASILLRNSALLRTLVPVATTTTATTTATTTPQKGDVGQSSTTPDTNLPDLQVGK